MKTRDVVIGNAEGLHLRVAAKVAALAGKFCSEISISCEDCPKANACSVLQLLMLGGERGKVLRVEAEGADEERAVAKIAEYFESGAGI